jgi:hypothetical protein
MYELVANCPTANASPAAYTTRDKLDHKTHMKNRTFSSATSGPLPPSMPTGGHPAPEEP